MLLDRLHQELMGTVKEQGMNRIVETHSSHISDNCDNTLRSEESWTERQGVNSAS